MFKSIGLTEGLIIVAIVLVLVSGKKVPDFFKSLGESIREFKKASDSSDSKKD